MAQAFGAGADEDFGRYDRSLSVDFQYLKRFAFAGSKWFSVPYATQQSHLDISTMLGSARKRFTD